MDEISQLFEDLSGRNSFAHIHPNPTARVGITIEEVKAHAHRPIPADIRERFIERGNETMAFRRRKAPTRRRLTARRPKLAMRAPKRRAFTKRRPTIRRSVFKRKKVARRSRGTKLTRKTVMNALEVPQYYDMQTTTRAEASAAGTTFGQGLVYAIMTGFTSASIATDFIGQTLSVAHLAILAFASDPSTGINNFRYLLKSVRMATAIVNMNQGTANIVCYYCMARRDLPNTLAYQNMITTLQDGFIQNGDANAILKEECTPFQSALFCSNYKIYKVKKLVLLPGQRAAITITHKKPRMISMQHYASAIDQSKTWQDETYDTSFAKGSKFVMYKITGQLAENTAATGQTFTAPRVLFRTDYRYEWKADPIQFTVIRTLNAGVTAPGATPIIVQPLTGTIINPVNA